MLRSIYLDNFVKFNDRQTITFKENENPCIFVGENGSGKTSVIEGIRRCLPKTASTLQSSVFNEERHSIFVCKYDTSKCSDPVDEDLKTAEVMFSGIIKQAQADNKSHYFKFVSTKQELLIDVYPNSTGTRSFRETDIFNKLDANTIEAVIIEDIINRVNRMEDSQEVSQETLEKKLKLLEKYVIMTFPSRSIGPLQWSKSEKIAEEKREENYKEAGKRAEIIRYFLLNENEFDTDNEKEIFSYLTGNDEIIFSLDEDEHVNVKSKGPEKDLPGGKFALLKLPEGILEAKYFSILMSKTNCQTLALEEPDKGMHPQMVEKMLAVIQKYSRNKTVILCTHNPYFVNPFTISRLLIFRRTTSKQDERGYHTEIISGNEIAKIRLPGEPSTDTSSEPSMKTLRILSRDHLADLIFAKRILFCEGDSDNLFLSALKGLVMKESQGIKRALGLIQNSDKLLDELQKIFVSLQIFSCNGWKNAELMHKVCETLKNDEHYFVCDKDAFVKDNGELKDNRWLNKPFYEKIFKQKKYDDKVREKILENCKVFIWQHGTIEDMAISLLRSESETKSESSEYGKYDSVVSWKEKRCLIDKLKEQNVNLAYSRWKEPRRQREDKDNKLYLLPEVTQENVEKSVEIFLSACDSNENDLVQFLQFLLDMEK